MWNELKGKGDLINEKGLKVFFGNQNFHPSMIENKISLYKVHQVHGKKIIKANNNLTKADAHWTTTKNCALLIQTADCMPIFLSDKKRNFVCAIHAGWRGVAQKILSESVKSIPSQNDLELWVGPHIKQKNFCLDPQSSKELLQPHGHPNKKDSSIAYSTPNRHTQNSIDLEKIIRLEAQNLNIKINYFSVINTYFSTKHFSHRRNPYNKGRQWAFITLN